MSIFRTDHLTVEDQTVCSSLRRVWRKKREGRKTALKYNLRKKYKNGF